MAWKDNPVGIVIDRSMNADFAALKTQGLSFVVIEAGTGWDVNPAFNEQYTKAVAVGLPVMVQYLPISAVDDYVFEAPAREQIPVLQKLIGTKKINGVIISMERYWVGWDLEQGHNPVRTATDTAIDYTAHEFANTFKKQFDPLGVPVMVRTNDNFVTKYSPQMSGWLDNFGFVLADWRYRLRVADGSYSLYVVVPAKTITTLADLHAGMPPLECKNPLVPGNVPQLKFWEYTGSVTMPLDLVKGWDGKVIKCKALLFNGTQAALDTYLNVKVAPPPVEPPPVDGTPVPPPPVDPPPTDPVEPSADIEEALSRIISLCEKMATDIAAIRSVFRA